MSHFQNIYNCLFHNNVNMNDYIKILIIFDEPNQIPSLKISTTSMTNLILESSKESPENILHNIKRKRC
jgi:hypothetical protein